MSERHEKPNSLYWNGIFGKSATK